MNIKPIDDQFRSAVDAYVRYFWGGPMMVTAGDAYDTRTLPGFVAEGEGALLGAALYRMANGDCEVAGIFALVQGQGVATKLLDAVKKIAISEGARRLWLVTTNDDIAAIRRYQRHGFQLKNVRVGAFEEVRRIKGELPQLGWEGIPIEHEFEFAMRLDASRNFT